MRWLLAVAVVSTGAAWALDLTAWLRWVEGAPPLAGWEDASRALRTVRTMACAGVP